LRLGEHDLALRPGEAAEFDTRTPHWFGNAGPEPAEVLMLFGPQGERMHLRARPAAGPRPRSGPEGTRWPGQASPGLGGGLSAAGGVRPT
jgi:Cupin domain